MLVDPDNRDFRPQAYSELDLLGAGIRCIGLEPMGTECDLDMRRTSNPRAGCLIQWRTTMTHMLYFQVAIALYIGRSG